MDDPTSNGGASTVREFCTAHRISHAFYYVMKAEGWGPREMWAGTRVLISPEAAADWRRAREAAAAAGVKRKFDAGSELPSSVPPSPGGPRTPIPNQGGEQDRFGDNNRARPPRGSKYKAK